MVLGAALSSSSTNATSAVDEFMGVPAVKAEVVESGCCHGGVPALCNGEPERRRGGSVESEATNAAGSPAHAVG
jgi:hypothetical protein